MTTWHATARSTGQWWRWPAALMIAAGVMGGPEASAAGTAGAAGAAAPAVAPDEAARLFAAGDWAGAAAAYEAEVARDAKNATAWYRLGSARHRLGRFEDALAAYDQAAGLQPAMRNLRYNIACAAARLGQVDRALAELGQAIDTGFVDPDMTRQDPDFESLKQEPRFGELVARAERAVRPCLHDPAARQFDFWLGDWEVFTPQGDRAGHNRITLTDFGCVLQEEWTGRLGGTGRSLNFYDAGSGQWNQIWVDSSGNILRYEGGLRDGAMVMIGVPSGRRPGQTLRTTWAALPDGQVRHASEVSSDGGRTWEPRFELLYRRGEGPAR
jgi:hypothetical protein